MIAQMIHKVASREIFDGCQSPIPQKQGYFDYTISSNIHGRLSIAGAHHAHKKWGHIMRNTPKRLITALIMALFIAGAALAQGPFGAGSSKFREEYKYTFELIQTMNQIDAMNRDTRSGFDRAQAKKVLTIINPLQKQPKLTQKQAQQALAKLQPIVKTSKATAWQKSSQTNRTHRPGESYRPGGTDKSGRDSKSDRPDKNYRPDSQRKPDARGAYRPDYKPEQMKDFNPFYNKKTKGDSWQEMQAKRMSDIISDIEKTSRGQKLSPLSMRSYQPDKAPSMNRYTPNNSKPNGKYVPREKAPKKG